MVKVKYILVRVLKLGIGGILLVIVMVIAVNLVS